MYCVICLLQGQEKEYKELMSDGSGNGEDEVDAAACRASVNDHADLDNPFSKWFRSSDYNWKTNESVFVSSLFLFLFLLSTDVNALDVGPQFGLNCVNDTQLAW